MVSNYTAAALTIFAFVPLLQSSPRKTPVKIVVLSSLPGSAGALVHLGSWASVWAGYSASKAAANMLFQEAGAWSRLWRVGWRPMRGWLDGRTRQCRFPSSFKAATLNLQLPIMMAFISSSFKSTQVRLATRRLTQRLPISHC
jgi:hypothetical protein